MNKHLFQVYVFVALSGMFGACCETVSDREHYTRGSLTFIVSDPKYIIQRIESIGGSSDPYSYKTLNPGDTISSYRVFYSTKNQADSVWNGIVTLSYTWSPVFRKCDRDVEMDYKNIKVFSTTFTYVGLYNNKDVYGTEVTITP
jgi:hypothetical protein